MSGRSQKLASVQGELASMRRRQMAIQRELAAVTKERDELLAALHGFVKACPMHLLGDAVREGNAAIDALRAASLQGDGT